MSAKLSGLCKPNNSAQSRLRRGWFQQAVQAEYRANTLEEITYCQKIFNDVGYHGIWVAAPAPFPWTKESGPTLAMSRPRDVRSCL